MSSIIDILAITAGYGAYFKAIVGCSSVTVTNTGSPGNLQNVYGKYRFERGDSFNIVSAGIALQPPFVFSRIKTVIEANQCPFPNFSLDVIGATSGNHYPIPILGGDSWIALPFENTDITLNTFVNVLAFGIDEPFFMTGKIYNCYVNMLTVPAALDGITFSAIPYFKIQHNKPLY